MKTPRSYMSIGSSVMALSLAYVLTGMTTQWQGILSLVLFLVFAALSFIGIYAQGILVLVTSFLVSIFGDQKFDDALLAVFPTSAGEIIGLGLYFVGLLIHFRERKLKAVLHVFLVVISPVSLVLAIVNTVVAALLTLMGIVELIGMMISGIGNYFVISQLPISYGLTAFLWIVWRITLRLTPPDVD